MKQTFPMPITYARGLLAEHNEARIRYKVVNSGKMTPVKVAIDMVEG